MLDKFDTHKEPVPQVDKEERKQLEKRLGVLQQQIKALKIPVVVIFEGWGASGKGSTVSDLILNLDPRGFKVYSTQEANPLEKRRPELYRFWDKVPEYGYMSIFDRSWYMDISTAVLEEGVEPSQLARRTADINTFERQLTDDGSVLLKFFLHISKDEQQKRLEKLAGDSHTRWRVTERDWQRNENYSRYYKAFDNMLETTNTSYAPWYVLDANKRKNAVFQLYRIVIERLEDAIDKKQNPLRAESELKEVFIDDRFLPLKTMPRLREIDLDRSITRERYKALLKEKQERLNLLHNRLYLRKKPVILVYEGWDAAGKGGNIKRVAAALDPRGYEVVTIAAPEKFELYRHYLWRFWRQLPKTGHISIFDRSWYGRVMVERLEGFCSHNQWMRAFNEINEFEAALHDWGAIVIKFWMHIDKDEQLARFTLRQNTPEKQYKITEEDWRNREKWDLYEEAVDDMIRYTSTEFAPWHIIESNDKCYARIKTLDIIISKIEAAIGK